MFIALFHMHEPDAASILSKDKAGFIIIISNTKVLPLVTSTNALVNLFYVRMLYI